MAASAWDGLASDLSMSASSFDSVLSGLTSGQWTGPASASMAAAAAPYVGWLSAAAGQAEAAASQARAAATAFESALAATIPPAMVSANRTQLLALVATNILGQNTPAIFATEAEYMEFWAQDVGAMLGYHAGATTVASSLPAFDVPPVSLAGLSGLAAPLSGLSGISSLASTGVSSALSTVGPAVSGVGEAASEVVGFATSNATSLVSVAQLGSVAISPIMMAAQAGMGGAHGATLAGATDVAADTPKFVGATAPGLKGIGGGGGLGGMDAGLGKARLVGAMSVPPTWQGSTPARMVSSAMQGMEGLPNAAAAGAPAGGGMPMMPMPMGMGGAGGGMPGGMMGRGGASPNHVVQSRPSVVPRTGVG
jgi:PPE-repeat protein